jgi:mono/diheme cytochrome c family protein
MTAAPHLFAAVLGFFPALFLAGLAQAQGDVAEGRKLVAENHCETCHHNKTMGDANAIYLRKDRKVTSMEKLKAQVAACNSQLNLKIFPDDEEHIVAYLNATYYKFAVK